MAGSEGQLASVRQALDALSAGGPLAPVLERCIRIASLRQDYLNVWWLRREALGFENRRSHNELSAEMKAHFAEQDYKALRTQFVEDQIERHSIERINDETGEDEKGVTAFSIGELEAQVENMEAYNRDSAPPPGLSAVDLYDANRTYQRMRLASEQTLREFKRVRSRIRERLHRFLVETEAALAFEQTAASTFERTRRFVDGQLGTIAPDALTQLQAAYERSDAGHPEALSHALTSCRRVLKSLADALYPATDVAITGGDGKVREMTDDKYRNRLWQYVAEQQASSTSRQLVQAIVEEVGRRVDLLNELSSKGVHDQVTREEVDQCVLQTYLLAGELFRLRTKDSSGAA